MRTTRKKQTGPAARNRRPWWPRVAGVSDPAQRREVAAAVRRGRAPGNPALDEATLDLADQHDSGEPRALRGLVTIDVFFSGVGLILLNEERTLTGPGAVLVGLGLMTAVVVAALLTRGRRNRARMRAAVHARTQRRD